MLVSVRLRDRLAIELVNISCCQLKGSDGGELESRRVRTRGDPYLIKPFSFRGKWTAKHRAQHLYRFPHFEGQLRLIHKQGPGLKLTKKIPPQLNKYTSRVVSCRERRLDRRRGTKLYILQNLKKNLSIIISSFREIPIDYWQEWNRTPRKENFHCPSF